MVCIVFVEWGIFLFFFSCDQAALWIVQFVCLSVCLSVCPSVCLSFCLSVRPSVRLSRLFPIIVSSWNCQELLPMAEVMSMQKVTVKGQRSRSQRSKVKVTEVNNQHSCFRTVSWVRIHIWWWNDAQSLMLLRRSVLLFFKLIRQISRSHG